MSPSSAWSCGLSANVNRPIRTIPTHSQTSVRAGRQEHDEPDGAAEVDADDQRLAADPVRQPAGDERHRDREDDQRAVHQPGRRLVEAEDLGHVDQREEVDHAEAAAAATQGRRQVQPAQVAVGEDPAEARTGRVPLAQRRRAVRAALADEQQDEDRDRRSPATRRRSTRRASRPRRSAGRRSGRPRPCRRCRPRYGR